jgi:hypothetical protein
VSAQPWLGLLLTATVVGCTLATACFAYCLAQVSNQKQPRVPGLAWLARRIAFWSGGTSSS